MTMDLSGDHKFITFWDQKHKLNQEGVQESVEDVLETISKEPDDKMMKTVQLKMIEIKWLKQGGKNFLNLVSILNESKN